MQFSRAMCFLSSFLCLLPFPCISVSVHPWPFSCQSLLHGASPHSTLSCFKALLLLLLSSPQEHRRSFRCSCGYRRPQAAGAAPRAHLLHSRLCLCSPRQQYAGRLSQFQRVLHQQPQQQKSRSCRCLWIPMTLPCMETAATVSLPLYGRRQAAVFWTWLLERPSGTVFLLFLGC